MWFLECMHILLNGLPLDRQQNRHNAVMSFIRRTGDYTVVVYLRPVATITRKVPDNISDECLDVMLVSLTDVDSQNFEDSRTMLLWET